MIEVLDLVDFKLRSLYNSSFLMEDRFDHPLDTHLGTGELIILGFAKLLQQFQMCLMFMIINILD